VGEISNCAHFRQRMDGGKAAPEILNNLHAIPKLKRGNRTLQTDSDGSEF